MNLFRSLLIGCLIIVFASEHAQANSGGMIGVVQIGCTCHGNASSGTSLSIPGRSTAITVKPGETLSLSLIVAHSSQSRAGMNVAVLNSSGGNAGTLQAGSGSQLISGQLTHTSPQAISNGSASFPFQWIAPAAPGTYTLRAVGNAVNGDGGSGGDGWNFLAPITITVENPAPTTFSISGRILNASGVAVAGVSVNDGTRSATTDANGNYTITDVPNGTYTITPSLANWVFEPTTLTVQVNGANVSGQNITGRRLWAVSGTITNPSGVPVANTIVLAYSGTSTIVASTATTDAAGNYTLRLLNGTYSIVPKQINWTFEPGSLTVQVNGADVSGRNITGRRLWAITGTITNPSGAPVSDVIVSAEPSAGGAITTTATTDAQGNYTLWVANGAYNVRASRTNWTFSVPQLLVIVSGANAPNQNITGFRLWAVTGSVVNPNGEPVANVSISAANGTLTASTATTDAQGNYTLWLVNGTYSLTPSRANWSFTPSAVNATVNGANLTIDRITGRLLMSVRTLEQQISVSLAPNPAREQVVLSYTISLPQGRIRTEVFNVLGERVRSFFDGNTTVGKHQSVLSVEDLPLGAYFVLIVSETNGLLGSASLLVRGQ